jgi:hypothetical protein
LDLQKILTTFFPGSMKNKKSPYRVVSWDDAVRAFVCLQAMPAFQTRFEISTTSRANLHGKNIIPGGMSTTSK